VTLQLLNLFDFLLFSDFTARCDAVHSATTVCLSVALWYYANIGKRIVEIVSPAHVAPSFGNRHRHNIADIA